MIRPNDIQETLLHLVGWQQHYDTSQLKIAESLTKSESGLYYQQVHPLLTLEGLASVAPDFGSAAFPEYDPVREYAKGDKVSSGGTSYKALRPVTGSAPGEDPGAWEETSHFSEWLEDKTRASIQKAVSRFCSEKMAGKTYRTLCEARTLFDGTGRISETEANMNRLVGFEIVPVRAMGVTTRISRIGLQFTEPGEYVLYLMHSGSYEPVREIRLTRTRRSSMEWFDMDDLYLPYSGDDTDAGGSWYLCYFQSGLPSGSRAVRKDRDWSKGPCKSCSRREFVSWQAWSRYLEVHPFFVDEEDVERASGDDGLVPTYPYLWDIGRNTYTYDTNYGINLEVSVGCDITDFIIAQRSRFLDVITGQLAVDMLREFAFNASVRTNRHSINASRMDIIYELDGDSSSMKKSGLSYRLDQAFAALEISTEGLSRVCLPCRNNGIKYRTV